MTGAEVKSLKDMLEAKRRELMKAVHGGAARLAVEAGESDPLDQMVSMTERDVAAAMVSRLSSTLADIDRSLRAIPEGCYGLCMGCEEPISVKRLRTIPWAAYCVRCQEEIETNQKQRSELRHGLSEAA